VRASAGSNALWVRVAEGGGAEDAVRAGVVDAVRRLLPALSMDVRADLQVRGTAPRPRPGALTTGFGAAPGVPQHLRAVSRALLLCTMGVHDGLPLECVAHNWRACAQLRACCKLGRLRSRAGADADAQGRRGRGAAQCAAAGAAQPGRARAR